MLNIPGLLDVLDIAKSNGIYIDYVETNSSWYSDHDSCCRILEKLPRQGVSTLLVSISPFHNEFIPFYKVKGVIQACRSTGIQVFPWISDFYSEIDQLDDSQKHAMQEYAELFGPNYEKQLLNRYWISPGGRALDLLRSHKPSYTVDEILAANPMGCSELTDVSHFHIDLYNNYIPGLCTGLAIHREDLGKPLLPQEYPFLNILYNKGIQAFFKYAQENTGFTPGKDTYINKCELCFEIRSCFINAKNITSKELQPVQHYMI